VEYAVRIARHAGVATLALTHHDPLRDDESLDLLVEDIRAGLKKKGSSLEVFAAAEGQSIQVNPGTVHLPENPEGDHQAKAAIDPARKRRSVVLAVSGDEAAKIFAAAAKAEDLPLHTFSDPSRVAAFLETERPSLVILEHDPPHADGLAICRAIRQLPMGDEQSLPVIMVAAREDRAGGLEAGVTEWLVKPFTASYIRTKLRAWILRMACHWVKAQIPEDEERRLSSLRTLRILDTDFEPRFDRLTRVAAALFDVPVALVSLVDRDRQWMKSCFGTTVRETPRDVSFCAHVVYQRDTMIVPDTLRDPRFGDNPLVINEPRIRFYAGAPLILNDGSCVGTLCLIDTRVRSLDVPSVSLLQDLRDLVVEELQRPHPAVVV
jgi:DNA-binding response OmpR family regulator